MVKAIMHGCNGKMGQVISGLVKEDDVIEIVAGIDKFTGIENPYPVFTSLAECDVQADVVIDFSNAAAVDELLDVCVEKTLPVVLCTTGLSPCPYRRPYTYRRKKQEKKLRFSVLQTCHWESIF